ncbi:hypothetical protein [Methylobacterium sp. NFXW15]|uniref:hypothetical protein n=1 Tax=Methylobacterium sp. NFXW15 TaxID=2819512 RepID=UPI003CE84194
MNAGPSALAGLRPATPSATPFRRTCLECGQPFGSGVREAEFCGPPCRMVFNNRRAKRGAELYDLFMALRHDRRTATALKVWRLLNRCAAIFREEDRRERAGRRSWRDPAEILARRPYLQAEILRPAGKRPE